MTALGRYQVVGGRSYRGHTPGTVFEARLDRPAEARAVQRGSIRLIERIEPGLLAGTYRLPVGWPPQREEEP